MYNAFLNHMLTSVEALHELDDGAREEKGGKRKRETFRYFIFTHHE